MPTPSIIDNFKIQDLDDEKRALQICLESAPLRKGAICTLIIFGGLHWQGMRSAPEGVVYLHIFQNDNKIRCEKEHIPKDPNETWPPNLHGHTACLVDDYTVLVFGGFSHEIRKEQDSVYLFHTEARKWTLMESSDENYKPSARMFHSMVNISHSEVAIFGGRTEENKDYYFNDIAVLNWRTKQWRRCINRSPNVPKGRTTCACAFGEGNLVIFGGKISFFDYSNDVWYYNFAEQKWFEVSVLNPPCPRNATCFAQTSYQTRYSTLFLFGGGSERSNKKYYNDFYSYDVRLKKFTKLELSTAMSPLTDHSFVFVEKINSVLLFGGVDIAINHYGSLWCFAVKKFLKHKTLPLSTNHFCDVEFFFH